MPFISRSQIDPKVRSSFDRRYKAQLKEALLNPGLSEEQRQSLRKQLRRVGQAKVYGATAPSKSGDVS